MLLNKKLSYGYGRDRATFVSLEYVDMLSADTVTHHKLLALSSKLTFSPCMVLVVAVCYLGHTNKKLSYCWETVRRESMPRIAEIDVEMTT